MIRNLGVLLIINLLRIIAVAQPSIDWQKCYGGSNSEVFFDLILLDDTSTLQIGVSNSNNGDVSGNHGGTDSWIVKVSHSGNLIWQKCLGGSNTDGLGLLKEVANGYFGIIGATMSNDGDVTGNHAPGLYDAWFVITDSSGTITFQKCYGGSLHDGFYDFIETSDGYILLGGTASNDGDVNGNHHSAIGFGDVWLVKVDLNGNIQWQKCFGGFHDESGVTILETSNGGFILGCSSYSTDGDISMPYGMYDFWIVNVDSLGNLLSERSYGGSNDDYLFSVCSSGDGGFVLVGSTMSNDGLVTGNHSTNTTDCWVIKIDNIGNLLWQKCYAGSDNDYARSVKKTCDGGYILNGVTESIDGDVVGLHNPGGGTDMWLLKLDSMGNMEWQRCLGGSFDDQGMRCIQDFDSAYLAIGFSNSSDGDITGSVNHGNGDTWVVKLTPLVDHISSSGNYFSDCNAYLSSSNILISFYSNNVEQSCIQLYDLMGRMLLDKQFNSERGINNQEIEITNLPTGLFIIRIGSNEGNLIKEIINY